MTLVVKDSKSKIRVVHIELINYPTWSCIIRATGVFEGKFIEHPLLEIRKGKAGRTVTEQAILQYESLIGDYMDKGYKNYDELGTTIDFKDISKEELNNLLSDNKTDSLGQYKPMLAKKYQDCPKNILNEIWFASRKLDGVRALIDKSGIASRGGKRYTSLSHITEALEPFFKKNPNIILDGEIYKHDLSLQEISGLARLEKPDERTKELEYWIYDCIDTKDLSKKFIDRWYFLDANKELFTDKIKLVSHASVTGEDSVMKYHNFYVEEGFEGVILRDPEAEYGIGKRDKRMIKVKKYIDEEFKIVGIKEGLRDIDFVFTLETGDGQLFHAQPIGSWSVRRELLNNKDELIGKMATVKFFNWSDDGIPVQPKLKHIRTKGE